VTPKAVGVNGSQGWGSTSALASIRTRAVLISLSKHLYPISGFTSLEKQAFKNIFKFSLLVGGGKG
jgi:hypothetical protein